jgi:hypothetical protein
MAHNSAPDRDLTGGHARVLRLLPSRATIPVASLANVCHDGDFKGDGPELVKRFFDLHGRVACWSMHESMIRMPSSLLDEVGTPISSEGLGVWKSDSS